LTTSRPAPETPSPKEKERDECDLNLKKSNNTNRAKSPPPLPKTKPGQGTNTNNLGSSKNSQEYLEELELVAEQFEEAAADLILEGDDGLGVLKRNSSSDEDTDKRNSPTLRQLTAIELLQTEQNYWSRS